MIVIIYLNSKIGQQKKLLTLLILLTSLNMSRSTALSIKSSQAKLSV